MKIETTRFGTMETSSDELIHFRSGIIGFPGEFAYVLIPHATSSIIGWLQSVNSPGLAFPVVSAHGFVSDYPDVPLLPVAARAGLGDSEEELAILAVLSAARQQPATVNLLAPLLINSKTRQGAQVFLEGSRFSTRELFVIPATNDHDSSREGEREPAPGAAATG